MSKQYLVLFSILLMASCGNNQEAPDESLTTNEDSVSAAADSTGGPAMEAGWRSLFDGKSTKGWHAYNKSTVGAAWKVEDGLLYFDSTSRQGGQGGDLVTDEEFDNFHLKLEWKIAPKGNSGIIFYVREDAKYKESYNTGLEMQVVDNEGHPDGKIPKHQAGDLYDLIPASPKTVKPAGEWNLAEIVSNNGKLDLFLNGTKVVSTTLWDDNWKKLVAGSKFKTMKDFGTFHKGRIALQDHENTVHYRNIMIKTL